MAAINPLARTIAPSSFANSSGWIYNSLSHLIAGWNGPSPTVVAVIIAAYLHWLFAYPISLIAHRQPSYAPIGAEICPPQSQSREALCQSTIPLCPNPHSTHKYTTQTSSCQPQSPFPH